MGRELKRVALDFKWPIGMLWKGYINPYQSQQCKSCDGSGLNVATKQISDDWYDFERTGRKWSYDLTQDEVDALVAGGRLMDFTHTFVPGTGWQPKDPPYHPTATEVNEWAQRGMGHDAVNQWICTETRAKRLGVYGKCEFCDGEGEIWFNEKVKELSEAWDEQEQYDPPKGEGYQLWSTTTEGHPMSPVFDSLDALCEWAAVNATTFGSSKASASDWKRMLDDGLVYHKEGGSIFV